jgi:hypothetical protein
MHGLRETGHQSDSQHDDILLAIGERVLRSRHRALQEAPIPKEVRFAGDCDDRLIYLYDCFNRQPLGLTWQGQPESSGISR